MITRDELYGLLRALPWVGAIDTDPGTGYLAVLTDFEGATEYRRWCLQQYLNAELPYSLHVEIDPVDAVLTIEEGKPR